MSGWLDASDWKRAQETVPIVCVDVLPVQLDDSKKLAKVGLIFRDTPNQGRRWCVVGGRLWRNESMADAIARQLRETLGTRLSYELEPDQQPDYVAQYFTTARGVGTVDPRQHSLTPSFVVPLTGDPKPRGEAIDFRWFLPAQLPGPEEFGFGQDRIVAACLRSRATAFQAVRNGFE